MVLRKYILGLRIKSIYTVDLERIVFIELEGFNDVDDIINYKLVIELMGKHSNIILLDDSNVIIDSLRHIKEDNECYRNLLPHYKYSFPSTNKINFYDINSFEEFKKYINVETIDLLASYCSKKFNGISKRFIDSAISNLGIIDVSEQSLKSLYKYILNTINNLDLLTLKVLDDKKDYVVELCQDKKSLDLNFAIDDFYTAKENDNNFKVYRDSVLKLILATLKRYNKRLFNIDAKLNQCNNMDTYQLYGELITANLYRITNQNSTYIELENYYDNNNIVKIPLDNRYPPNENAKRYFKKYNKLKNALEIVSKQKEETLHDINYIESVVYEIESCSTLEEIDAIFEEILEHDIFKDKRPKSTKKMKVKKSQLTRNKTVSFNPIKYTVDNYTIFVGRNNKENDYLTLKFAKKSDYWFHTKDIHGSHVILKLNQDNNLEVPTDLLIKCAEIAAFHSKAKNSSNVPVDYCLVKYVKKPSGAKPGMVIYTNNKTLNVQPQISEK